MHKFGIPPRLIPGKAYIGGAWVLGKESKAFAVTNPDNDELLSDVPDLGVADTAEALGAARSAFTQWRKTSINVRSRILRKWGELLMANQEHLAKIITLENGKPLKEAVGEITFSASYFDWFAEEARRIYGEVVPTPDGSKRMMLIRQPVGVAGLITPWNHPAGMLSRKVSAVLAAGCTAVLKPAEDTPLTALVIAKLGEEAGVPPGVFNVLTCSRYNTGAIGQALCESPLISALSFTGSSEVGKLLLRQSADTVKKVSLELGGHAVFIVFESAHIDEAVRGAIACKFRGSGQTCVSATRILIQDVIYDEFCSKFTKEVKKLVVGDGMKDVTTQGPLINQRGVEKVQSHVDDAVKRGAKILVGGKPHNLRGNFFEPTVLSDIPKESILLAEETFGPLAALIKFKTEKEAVEIANNTPYGLASYFYSQDTSQIWRVAEEMEVGMVAINEGLLNNNAYPMAFGGVKESGTGREGSKYGIEEYLELKAVVFGGIE